MGVQYRTSTKGGKALEVTIDYSRVRSLGLNTYTMWIRFVVFGFCGDARDPQELALATMAL